MLVNLNGDFLVVNLLNDGISLLLWLLMGNFLVVMVWDGDVRERARRTRTRTRTSE